MVSAGEEKIRALVVAHRLNDQFPDESALAICPFTYFFRLLGKKTFTIKWRRSFSPAGCPACHETVVVENIEGNSDSDDPNLGKSPAELAFFSIYQLTAEKTRDEEPLNVGSRGRQVDSRSPYL